MALKIFLLCVLFCGYAASANASTIAFPYDTTRDSIKVSDTSAEQFSLTAEKRLSENWAAGVSYTSYSGSATERETGNDIILDGQPVEAPFHFAYDFQIDIVGADLRLRLANRKFLDLTLLPGVRYFNYELDVSGDNHSFYFEKGIWAAGTDFEVKLKIAERLGFAINFATFLGQDLVYQDFGGAFVFKANDSLRLYLGYKVRRLFETGENYEEERYEDQIDCSNARNSMLFCHEATKDFTARGFNASVVVTF